MTTEERQVHKILQSIFHDVPLEAARARDGFWGRACARLIDKNQKLESALEASQREAENYKNLSQKLIAKCDASLREAEGLREVVKYAQWVIKYRYFERSKTDENKAIYHLKKSLEALARTEKEAHGKP